MPINTVTAMIALPTAIGINKTFLTSFATSRNSIFEAPFLNEKLGSESFRSPWPTHHRLPLAHLP